MSNKPLIVNIENIIGHQKKKLFASWRHFA